MTGLKINTACTCPNWEGGTDRVSKWAGFMLAVYVGPFVRRSMLPVSKLWLFKAPSTLASKSLTTGPKIAAIPSAITVADSSSDFFVLSLTTLVSGAHAASVMFFLPSSSSSSSWTMTSFPNSLSSHSSFDLLLQACLPHKENRKVGHASFLPASSMQFYKNWQRKLHARKVFENS